MLARLTVHFPLQPTRRFRVEGSTYSLIGRDPECTIVLDDERVSRRHAQLEFSEADGAWRVVDLGSKNGTSLSGRPVRDAVLGGDAWISFGGLLARFEHSTEEREREEARRRERRQQTSISMQRELRPALGLDKLLERVLASVVELAEAERGFVLLRRDDGELRVAALRGVADAELRSEGFSGSVTAIERALATLRPVAVSDAQLDATLQDQGSVVAAGIRSLVCVPLIAVERLTGVIYADSRRAGTGYDALDVEILMALSSHAALAIAMAQVDRELKRISERLPDDAPTAAAWSTIVAHHRARQAP